MADYKRMVSYIYNYENGKKKNNVGFARIEISGQQCKVTVHVKAPSIKGNLKVCFFFRKKESVRCIVLGEMGIQNGIGEFKGVTSASKLMETSYPFEEMEGMILFESKDKFFGSEWDDRPIQLEDVGFIDKEDNRGEDNTLKPEASPNGSRLVPEKEEPKKEEPRREEPKKLEESISKETGVDVKEKVGVVEEEPEEESPEGIKLQEESTDDSNPFDSFTKQLQAAEYVTKMLNFQKPVIKNAKQSNRNVVSGRKIKKDTKDVEFAEYLMEEYPKMYPFEDDEISGCVRIEPQDIGMFPMEMWSLANNSFLLQGYYSYRHLIFVQTKIGDMATYLLGVPGIYHNREEFMARMFGFHMFKTVKRKESKRGEFGYWFIHIKIPKNSKIPRRN